jgi:xanthine dehydrogenase molybdopterin-binding subunit B
LSFTSSKSQSTASTKEGLTGEMKFNRIGVLHTKCSVVNRRLDTGDITMNLLKSDSGTESLGFLVFQDDATLQHDYPQSN